MVWGATVRERLLTQHFLHGFWRTTCFLLMPITMTPSPWSAAGC